jgi:uncharacterized repeat protein (TIGR01451 family)
LHDEILGWEPYHFILPAETQNRPVVYLRFVITSDAESTRFLIDDITFQVIEACTAPVNLQSYYVSETSTQFSWDTPVNQPPGGYQYEIRTHGLPQSGDDGLVTGNIVASEDTTVVVSGLLPNISYDFYLRANCGSEQGYTDWTDTLEFVTDCVPYSIPYEESFDSVGFHIDPAMPLCWSQELISGSLQTYIADEFGSIIPFDGSGNFLSWYRSGGISNGTVTRVKSPEIVISGTRNIIRYYFYRNYREQSPTDAGMQIQFSYDNTIWYNLGDFNGINDGGIGWMSFETPLPDTLVGETIRLAILFSKNSGYASGLYLDQLTISNEEPMVGIYRVPGDYPKLTELIDDLNRRGVGLGGVQFEVDAGNPQTAPPGGILISATGKIDSPIIINGNGNTITASDSHTEGALNDGVINILGGDYITINDFRLLENPSNIDTTWATNDMTEFGIGQFATEPDNGSKHLTITNCVIDLNRSYANTFGFYSNSQHTYDDVLSFNSLSDEANKDSLTIQGCYITDVNYGIVVNHRITNNSSDAKGLIIGGNTNAKNFDPILGNTIENFGSYGNIADYAGMPQASDEYASYGIYVRGILGSFSIESNTLTSAEGATMDGDIYGIYLEAAGTDDPEVVRTIDYNRIEMSSGNDQGDIYGIFADIGNKEFGDFSTSHNSFYKLNHENVGTAGGNIRGVYCDVKAGVIDVNYNTFNNLRLKTRGSTTLIDFDLGAYADTMRTNYNQVVAGLVNNANAIDPNQCKIVGIYGGNAKLGGNNEIAYNELTDISNDATIIVIRVGDSQGHIHDNIVGNITSGDGSFNDYLTAIYCAGGRVDDNHIYNLVSKRDIKGIHGSDIISASGNLIHGLSDAESDGGAHYGLYSSSTNANIFNNIIYDFNSPTRSATVGDIGIYITGSYGDAKVYNNTVYLDIERSNSNPFGSAALYTDNAVNLDLRNNVLINTSDRRTNFTTALQFESASMANYNAISDANDLYVGSETGKNVFRYGTTNYQTIDDFKTLTVAQNNSSDARSFSEFPPFVNTGDTIPIDLHVIDTVQTRLEKGGVKITSPINVNTDFDGDQRGFYPDVGADEFDGLYWPLDEPQSFTARGRNSHDILIEFVRNVQNEPLLIIHNDSGIFTDIDTIPIPGEEFAGGEVVGIFDISPATHIGVSGNDTTIKPGDVVHYKAFSTILDRYSEGVTVSASPNVYGPVSIIADQKSSQRIDLTINTNEFDDDVIIAYDIDDTFGVPVDGQELNVGETLPGGLGDSIIYKGPAGLFSHQGLQPNVTYYYKAWTADSYNYYSAATASANATTAVFGLLSFDASRKDSRSIALDWTFTAPGYDIVVVAGTSSDLGTPIDEDPLSVGDPAPSGFGTVIYRGQAENFDHESLTYENRMYYKAWVVDADDYYSIGYTDNEYVLVASPQSISAMPAGPNSVQVDWQKNQFGNEVIIAYTPTANFGIPSNEIPLVEGNIVPSGDAVVIYKGPLETFDHENLINPAPYYYAAWSVDAFTYYSPEVFTSLTSFEPSGSIKVAYNWYNQLSPEQLIDNVLISECVEASNVKYGYYSNTTGDWTDHSWLSDANNRQLGYFNKSISNFPVEEGLILSSGNIKSAEGPNDNDQTSDYKILDAGDPDLTAISGFESHDAAILEFDFVASGSQLQFSFVFASEEYLEFVQTQFNDAFGFFLSGPGITGPYTNNAVNLAELPNGDPISVNSIHPSGVNIDNNHYSSLNPEYYINNPPGSLTTEFDGNTVVLTVNYEVTPCTSYHMKFAVADASDQRRDGAIFFKAKSFETPNYSITHYNNGVADKNHAFEGCSDTYLEIRRYVDSTLSEDIDLEYLGTAINGTDYTTLGGNPLPTTITMAPSQGTYRLDYLAVSDPLEDPNEFFTVRMDANCECSGDAQFISQTVDIYDSVRTTAIAQNLDCSGTENGVILLNSTGGTGNYRYSIDTAQTWNYLTNNFTGLSTGDYMVLIQDTASCYSPDTIRLTIGPAEPIVATINPTDPVICETESIQLFGSGGVNYAWSPTTGLNDWRIANPIATPETTTIYTLTVSDSSGTCTSIAQTTVTVNTCSSTTPLDIIKSADIANYNSEGQGVNYTIVLSNNGTDQVTNITVSDPVLNMSETITTLLPGQDSTYQIPYRITMGDMSQDSVINGVTALGYDIYGSVMTAFDDEVIYNSIGSNPDISITKTASQPTYSVLGETITYTIRITNIGLVNLFDATMTDPMTGLNQNIGAIVPGEFRELNVNYDITQADLDAGSLTNTATVTADDGSGTNVTDDASVTINATQTPTLNVTKVPDKATYNAVGELITYTITLENTGNVTLSNIVTTDPLTGMNEGPITLGPQAKQEYTTTYNISQTDIDAGSLTNTVTSQAKDPSNGDVTATANATVNAVQSASLDVTKVADKATYSTLSEEITYTITINNTGNVTLTSIQTEDPLTGFDSTGVTLVPGASEVYTTKYDITQVDLDNGSLSNTAITKGRDPSSVLVEASDTETITANQNAQLQLTKSPNPTTYSNVGDVITYTITLENIGNVTISNINTTDPLTGMNEILLSLAPAATETYTTSYTIIQSNIDNGSVINTATAQGEDPNSNTVSATANSTVTLAQVGIIQASITANEPDYCGVGEVINFVIVVENSGPVDLNNVIVTDDKTNLNENLGTLVPGDSQTINRSYTIVQQDIDNGSITNTVIAEGTDPSSNTATDTDNATSTANPTPDAPTITVTAPTCTTDGSALVSNYDAAYTYTFDPAGPTVDGSGNIASFTLGQAYTITATNADACESAVSSSFTIEEMLPTPDAPTIAVTAPTCTADGSASISNYDAAYTYTFDPAGPTVDGSGNIANFTLGQAYTITATNADACESASSSSFTIEEMLPTPDAPTIAVTAPTCTTDGSALVSNYNAAYTYTFDPVGPTVDGSGNIANFTLGQAYTITATNADACESAVSSSFTIEEMLPTPDAPIIAVTAPTCTTDGSAMVSNYNAAYTYTFDPAGPTVDGSGNIASFTLGQAYTITATNADACESASSSSFTIEEMLPTPDAPTIAVTAPTCSADGSASISNYNAAYTYTFDPAGPTVDGSGNIANFTLGQAYTITATNADACESAVSSSFTIEEMLPTPDAPTITVTAPTCTTDGSALVSNYDAAYTYTFDPAGPTVDGSGNIANFTLGQAYTITATNADACESASSSSFTIEEMLPTPDAPTIAVTAPTCTTDGSALVSNYNAAYTYTFDPVGPTVDGSGNIANFTLGQAYTITATNADACESAVSSSFTIEEMLPTPDAPIIAVTAPTCTTDGSALVSNYNAAYTYTFDPAGPTVDGSGNIASFTLGQAYTITATNADACESASSSSFTIEEMLPTPDAPSIAVTAPTCTADGSASISNYNAAYTYTFDPAGPTVDGSGNIASFTLGQAYTITATNADACESAVSSSFTIEEMLPTPDAPTIAVTAPTCTTDGSALVSNYNAAYTYTFDPAGPTVDGSGNIANFTLGQAYTITATNADACESAVSSSFTIEEMLPTPDAPTIAVTAPTCTTDGSALVSNYDAGYTYTFDPVGPTVDGSGNIANFTLGQAYTITATNADACESASSSSFTIEEMLPTPDAPTITVTAPTCTADGSASISNYNAAYTYTFDPAGPTVDGSGNIANFTLGQAYTLTATNADACESASSSSFTIEEMLPTPDAPIIAVTAPTCTADGSASISNYNAAYTYTFDPAGPTVDGSGNIANFTLGQAYTLTATNTDACESATSSSFTIEEMLPTPDAPTIAVTAPTCTADGSASISNYDAAYTYTFDPTGPSVDGSGNITSFTTGQAYTLTATNTDACESAVSSSFTIEEMLPTPDAPTITVTAPTCTTDGSALVSNYNAAYTYTFDPVGPTVDGSGNIANFTLGQAYTLTATNADACESASSSSFTIEEMLPTPDAPTIAVTAPTCTTDGSALVSNYDAGYTYTFDPVGPTVDGSGNIANFTLGQAYTITATNADACESASSSSFTIEEMLPTPDAPTITVTAPTCTTDGSALVSNYDAGYTYTFDPAGPTVDGSGNIANFTLGQAYSITATNADACESASSSSFTIEEMLPTPDAPIIAVTAPTCTADGSASISNYDAAYTYTFDPAGPTVDGSGNIASFTLGQAYTITATNADACESASSSSFTIEEMLPTPDAPTIAVTAPTCTTDGSALVSNYNAAYTYTFDPAGPTVDGSGNIANFTLGQAYTLTATNADACESASSSSFTIEEMLPTPDAPTITVTAPTCTADGSASISNYNAAYTYTFDPAGPTVDGSGNIANFTLGQAYTLTATNADACESASSSSFTIEEMLPTPDAPTITVTAPTCATDGSALVSNYDAAYTYTFDPVGPTVDGSGNIASFTLGQAYTITATNADACESAASSSFTIEEMLPTPDAPIIAVTAPTCATDGSALVSNYDAAYTYTFDPAGPTVDGSGNIANFTLGQAYSITATNADACESASSSSFTIEEMLPTPDAPTITVTAPTCTTDGSALVSNYDAAYTYTFDPAGPTVDGSGNIASFTLGQAYTITATNADACESAVSSSFTIEEMLPTPDAPTIAVTAPTCTADGSASISNYDAAYTYTFDPAGPTVDGSGNIANFTLGQAYTITATNADACESASSSSFTIEEMLPTPDAPTIAVTAPTCTTDGSALVSNYDAAYTYTFDPVGPTVDGSGNIASFTLGQAYTITATNADACESAASSSFHH